MPTSKPTSLPIRRMSAMPRYFSMVEMMTVLIIVGLLMGAVLGSFDGIAKGNNVDSGARMISSQLFLARSYAISQREYVAVVFSNNKESVSTWLCNASNVCTAPVPNTQWNPIPVGTVIEPGASGFVTISGITGPIPADNSHAIVFKPNGSLSTANDLTVKIKSKTVTTNILSMTVNWLTGRVTFPQ